MLTFPLASRTFYFREKKENSMCVYVCVFDFPFV